MLPTFLLLLLLALQPICILYTTAVMESAAAQTARLMVTAEADDTEDGSSSYRAFAMRRLEAVPNVGIFHEGGPLAWDIDLGFAGSGSGARVRIEGAVRPLPVLGAFARAFGKTDASGNVQLEVEVAYEGRPSWLEGSYETWTGVWE